MSTFKKSIIGFLILFLWGIPFQIIAQSEINGIIKDKISSNPITGANVYLKEKKSGTSTNSEGIFKIENLNPGIYQLNISHVGYIDTSFNVNTENPQNLTIVLIPDSIEMSSIVITATRTKTLMEEVPQRINKIDRKTISDYPATNTDNILRMIPGINVNRSSGIFSRNSSVTMRGMPGASRSLILLDGVPLNKSAGGTINWHLITPNEIERIEVVKGPGSALYGKHSGLDRS